MNLPIPSAIFNEIAYGHGFWNAFQEFGRLADEVQGFVINVEFFVIKNVRHRVRVGERLGLKKLFWH